MVVDADVHVTQPVSKAGSVSSHSSLRHKLAMNEVRRAFFTSDSSSTLVDGITTSKISVKDVVQGVQISQSQEFPMPITDRLLLMLWFNCEKISNICVYFVGNRFRDLLVYASVDCIGRPFV